MGLESCSHGSSFRKKVCGGYLTSARHGVRGGFVCHDESEDVLLVSEDGFSEDPKAACWRLLDAQG